MFVLIDRNGKYLNANETWDSLGVNHVAHDLRNAMMFLTAEEAHGYKEESLDAGDNSRPMRWVDFEGKAWRAYRDLPHSQREHLAYLWRGDEGKRNP